MEEEKKIRLHPRRLARRMAKAELDRRGATGYNKPTVVMGAGRTGPSKFSVIWRKFALEASKTNNSKGAKKK